ncbi:hypothetical protein ACVH4F_27950, partial [Klebsiella pneumoniae]
QNDVTLKMPAFEWVHVQLHQQKGMISLSPPTICNSAFAPNSRHRALVTPAKRGRGNKVRVADEPATPAQRRASMTWAQRLKRVFNIDIETCSGCGGAMKVIACIEDPIVIKQILDHLKHKAETSGTRALPESRAPPAELLLGLFD